ncbi:MAG: N(4)-(beta-N-acetylglucosaminyl)-L-asparaginase [Bacteroidota bacterium]|nr:N(4)-(beta-N-acetylglucosaminyl)-L-asparaginase [Bacteroidota bacterium]
MEALATWKHGVIPNRISYSALEEGLTALDAVELGARYCESDETCMSVGRGGIPDEEGTVSLDASIMDDEGNCGSVAFVKNYSHPISIARRVMEKTPHVMLAGSGAEKFAEKEGFITSNLLTDAARSLYDKWKELPEGLNVSLRREEEGDHEYVFAYSENGKTKEIARSVLNESHDTIGLLARDKHGRIAGACTTSGLAFKMSGRVGDSPIIGAGLYVSGSVGAAVATGNGELVMRACSAFHIVELMRQGYDPESAVIAAIERIKNDKHLTDDMQVGFLVLRSDGSWAARSLREGYQCAVATDTMSNTLFNCSETITIPAPVK